MKTTTKSPKKPALRSAFLSVRIDDKATISLWEIMREIQAINLFQIDRILEEWITECDRPQGAILTEGETKSMNSLLVATAVEHLAKVDWEEVHGRILALQMTLMGGRWGSANRVQVSAESALTALRELQTEIYRELRHRKFFMLDCSKSHFISNKCLFGKHVEKAFPSAKSEIAAASKCLAFGLNTAAVFHLMRVMEYGLRALAVQMKARTLIKKLKQIGNFPNIKKTGIPIELGTWEEVISTADAKIDVLKSKKRSHKRDIEIEFYEEILREYRSVKLIWRNKVMHARIDYDYHQAQSAFDHVKAFMQRLATKVSETN